MLRAKILSVTFEFRELIDPSTVSLWGCCCLFIYLWQH